MVPHTSVIVNIRNALFLAILNPLHSSANQKLFENFVIKVSTMKNTDDLGSHHMLTMKLTVFY